MRFLLLISLHSLVLFATLASIGCAYPRRGTSLSSAANASGASQQPPNVWQLEFVSAVIPPEQRGALAWDDDDGPDVFIRVYQGDQEIWEGTPVNNTLTPTFDQRLPRNVFAPSDEELRFELWDYDGRFESDLIGIWRDQGWPRHALPGNDSRVMFDGRATIVFRIHPPAAHRGIGIKLFEIRPGSMIVLELQPFSPAVRAGVEVGDRIVEIDDQPVSQLSDARAVSALSLANNQQGTLVVERDGRRETLRLDGGFVWLTM